MRRVIHRRGTAALDFGVHPADDDSMTTSQAHTYTPAEILADIPGNLGFYPSESLVIVSFQPVHDCPESYIPGPLLRISIDDVDEGWEEGLALLDQYPDRLFFAFIISTRPERHLAELIDFLSEPDQCYLDLEGLWMVPEIQVGQPYEELFADPALHQGPGGDAWLEGRVAPITDSDSMRACIAEGELPALDRQECFEPFQRRNRLGESEELAALNRLATTCANDACCGHRTYGYDLVAIARDVPEVLSEIDGPGDVAGDADLLFTAAVWMGGTKARDVALGGCLTQPAAACTLMLALAQTFSGNIRANALAVYAVCSIEMSIYYKASTALMVGREEFPEHNFLRLLLSAFRCGLHEALIDSVRQGSEKARLAAVYGACHCDPQPRAA